MVELCLTLAADTLAGLQKKIEYFNGKIPIAEIRLDFLEEVAFPVLPSDSSTRFLATCRPVREGGKYNGPEDKRLDILSEAPDKGFSLVDVEHDVVDIPLFSSPVQVVRSRHDFEHCPPDLKSICREMSEAQGDLVKLVVTPGDASSLVHLLEFMEDTLAETPGIILGMGEASRVTRILGPFLGNFWTYVSEDHGGVAPGQFSLDMARNVYRLSDWRETPDLYGVACTDCDQEIDELVKSLNAGFKILGCNALAFPLSGMGMEIFLPYAESSKLPYRGFIELEPGTGKAQGGREQKLRRITLKKGSQTFESCVYSGAGEVIRDTISYWMD